MSGIILVLFFEVGVVGVMGFFGVIGGFLGVIGILGVMGVNGVCGGYKFVLDGGIIGFGVVFKEKLLRVVGDIMGF